MLPGLKRLFVAAVLLLALSARVSAQVAPATDVPDEAARDAQQQMAAHDGPEQPRAQILGWSSHDELENQPLEQSREIVLDAGHADLVIFFTAGQNGHKQPIEFRYRLDGSDADWTATRDHDAHYRRLAPGHYVFQVQARYPGQPWSVGVAQIAVEQKPFFYQTWYAGGLVALALLGLAVQLLHQRDQLLKGQMGIVLEERQRIASDCHDTLMAGFAAVSWQLETVRNKIGGEGESRDAATACELARSMVVHCQAEARRIIWDLRSPEGITDLLSEGLSAALEALPAESSMTTSLRVEGTEVPISPGAVHHLVCICQEAISNALHHAEATRVEVQVRYTPDSLNLTIADNGKGFPANDPKTRAGHFGLAVMEERARKLGGTMRLRTGPGMGTEVGVEIQFQGEYQPISQQAPVVPWIGV